MRIPATAMVAIGALVVGGAAYSHVPQPLSHAYPTAVREAGRPDASSLETVVERYCTRCHNERRLLGNLTLEGFDVTRADENAETAERMIRKLRAGMMPPPGVRRPTADTVAALAQLMEGVIDEAAAANPRPGTRPFQRLNRAEYARVVYDLFGLTVDPAEWLPQDRITAGFDNNADAQTLSATLMDAYLNAASEIARRAVGDRDAAASSVTYTNPPTVSQHEWERVEGAPFGTRGGISILHSFPADGEYTFEMSFMSGWGERFHDIDISIDGERVALLRYGGDIDFQGRKSFPFRTDPVLVRAGEHRVTAAFVRQMDGPYEDLIRPNDWSLTGTETSYGTTSVPHLMSLTLEGPQNPTGVSDFEARRNVFTCRPTGLSEERPCAEEILSRLAVRAYGRDLDRDELGDLVDFYELGAEDGGFETGIRTALEAILSSPHFLFRMEREPGGVEPGESYVLAGEDLAARLSFFLWGSTPDRELAEAARDGTLADPTVLEAQARRMLADPRSDALATRFAAMWLRLQDLENVEPDAFRFPNYSRQLADAMRRETELFFLDLIRGDRSLMELYGADYTFANERLARHYGIDGVRGQAFRRVIYPDDRRRGVLGHGSMLVQTSFGNRTSPVLRGKWVMEVLMGAPPPPPPPDIPELEETEGARDGRIRTTRERLEEHRANPACSSCHNFIDPIGLALDNFDVTGRWRVREQGAALDTRGTFYDGTDIASARDLSEVLLKRPIPLVRNFTQNLMAYALGRSIDYRDQPAVRAIARAAAEDDYRMSSFILGVVGSDAFRMRQARAGSSMDR
ncbi:MAG: DUF1592 domain-containing protein [Gemmatimonadota bacterium]|nr:DUF1592 domain-containing protein [Gemmatimonadota bacterium]